MLGNLHTHTRFSDGSSPPGDYIAEAVNQGFSVLGFTDHSPLPFPNTFAIPEGGLPGYVEAIMAYMTPPLQAEGSGIRHPAYEMDILLGLEYDYVPGLSVPVGELRDNFPFDYVIGSVHLVRNDHPGLIWFIDGPKASTWDKGLREIFGGDARVAVTAYWRQLQEMVISEKPDIIGHLDKIKMHNRNRYFSEGDDWYVSLVDETLDLIRQGGAVVEVNTRGLYKKRSGSLFPGPWILKKIVELNIPVTLSSDAHSPDELSLLFPETRQVLREIGFRNQWLLTAKGWKETGL